MIDHTGACSVCHRAAIDCKGGIWRLAPGGIGICINDWLKAGRSFGELPGEDVIDLASRRPVHIEATD